MNDNRFWAPSIETMPGEKRARHQISLLNHTLQMAVAGSPYYRAHLPTTRLDSLDEIRSLPFMTKGVIRDRQEAAPPFGDLVAVPEEEIIYISASSGSTGSPTASPFTADDFDRWMEVEARIFYGTGLRSHHRYCHALNFSLFVGGPCVLGAQRLGALCIHAGTIPSERLLHILSQFQPHAIWTTPSYAWYLGETAEREGIDPANDLAIERIYVAGEPGGSIPATRHRIETLWDAKVFDFFGISDIFGACAGECTEQAGMHIAEDQVLVEVIDPVTGEPVNEGERGEMVLTTLQKRARPLIRFRTGDIVSFTDEPCACGRTHRRLLGVHGRTDDMLIIKGVNLFPGDIEAVVRSAPDLSGEYRVIVDRRSQLDTLTLEVEARTVATDLLRQRTEIARELKARLGISAEVSVLPPDSLPRETHKARRIVDRRGSVWG